MRLRQSATLLLIGLLLSLLACSEESGATGAAGEWIKGKSLSVNVGMIGSMERTPFVSLRNDSDREVSITPMKIVAWYSKAGKKEDTLQFGLRQCRQTRATRGSEASALFKCERVRVSARDSFVYWR